MVDKLNRRKFIKYCGTIALALGLSREYGMEIARAVEQESKKPPLLWLEGQSCGGCLRSFLNTAAPSFGEIILDMLSVRYMETYSWSNLKNVKSDIDETLKDGKYILVVTGSIPTAENGKFCSDFDTEKVSFVSRVKKLGKSASAVIACGSCASSGGINASFGQFGVSAAGKVLPGKKVINIPGCPPHPDWLVSVVVSLLLYGRLPELDKKGKPVEFFSKRVHDDCPRRGAFEAGEFAGSFEDTTEGKCLYKLGCKGPVTYADCPKRKWNDNRNWCVGANSICIGCANPGFYDALAPVTSAVKELSIPVFGSVDARTLGKAAVIGTGLGIGADAAVRKFINKRKNSEEGD